MSKKIILSLLILGLVNIPTLSKEPVQTTEEIKLNENTIDLTVDSLKERIKLQPPLVLEFDPYVNSSTEAKKVIKQKAEETKETLEKQIEQKAQEIKEAQKALEEQLEQKTQEIEEAKKTLEEQIEQKVEEIEETKEVLNKQTEQKIEEISNEVENNIKEVSETLETTQKDIQQKIEENVEATQNNTDKNADEITDIIEAIEDSEKEKIEEAKEVLEEQLEQKVEELEETKEILEEQIEQKSEEIKEIINTTPAVSYANEPKWEEFCEVGYENAIQKEKENIFSIINFVKAERVKNNYWAERRATFEKAVKHCNTLEETSRNYCYAEVRKTETEKNEFYEQQRKDVNYKNQGIRVDK